MINEFDWECIYKSTDGEWIHRMKVNGGWLYRHLLHTDKLGFTHSICFVPEAGGND